MLALEGAAEPETVEGVAHAWCRLGAAARGLALLRENNVRELVLAGGVRRPSLAMLRPDWRAAKFFARVGYRALGDDGLLSAVVNEFEREGFRVIGADQLLTAGAGLAPEGALGERRPDAEALADIAHGQRIARAIGALDIGQAVVVQQGLVLGVEAIEGTDALLRRCAGLRRDGPGGRARQGREAGSGAARRSADDRAANRRRSPPRPGSAGSPSRPGRRCVLDRDEVVAAADRAGLFVVGIRSA